MLIQWNKIYLKLIKIKVGQCLYCLSFNQYNKRKEVGILLTGFMSVLKQHLDFPQAYVMVFLVFMIQDER